MLQETQHLALWLLAGNLKQRNQQQIKEKEHSKMFYFYELQFL
jgi:hypothetical protein